jgi:hypothetical protein
MEGISSSAEGSVSGNGSIVREKRSVDAGDPALATLLLIRMTMNSVATRILLLKRCPANKIIVIMTRTVILASPKATNSPLGRG